MRTALSSNFLFESTTTAMTARSLHTPLPSIASFEGIAAMLQPPAPQFSPLTSREETQLEILAHEIVRYTPELAGLLAQHGMQRLREDFADV